MKTLVVIDGNSMLHRAYHALPPMMTRAGVQTNAAYGFTAILFKMLNDVKPDAVAVAFDMRGGTFRNELYKEYKATREKKPQELYDQILFIKKILDAMNIPWCEQAGFEADDIIGTFATTVSHEKDWQVIVATGDMDALQLVDEKIKVYTLRKGITDVVVYDEAEVKARFGLSVAQLIDYKALRGDTSDNIKGVPGIGEKTATDLLQKFGTLEKLYAALEKGVLEGVSKGVVEKLKKGKEDAKLSKTLVTIVRDMKLPMKLDAAILKPFNVEAIDKVFHEFEFTSLIKRLPGNGGTVEQPTKKTVTQKKLKAEVMVTDEQWKEFISVAKKESLIAVAFHRPSQKTMFGGDELCVAVASKKKTCVFTIDSGDHKRTEQFVELLVSGITIVVFDVKQLMHEFKIAAPHTMKFFDVGLADTLVHAGRGAELSSLLFTYTGEALEETMADTSPQEFVTTVARGLYACVELLQKELQEQKQEAIQKNIEEPLLPVLYEMETAGIKIDAKKIAGLGVDAEKEIDRLTKIIHRIAGREFNVASPQQLAEILFDDLKIPSFGIKRGKNGLSTAVAELEKLQGQHEVIDYIFEYRELAKLRSTYIDALPQLVAVDGRVHTTFLQIGAATGRLASMNPNVQNIPARTELGRKVRSCFVAEEGYELLSGDYSQFELRIVAHMAQDAELIGIFNRGEDVHTSTAAKIHGIPLEKVTKEIRFSAKEVNFGVLYGMGTYGLAQRTGLSRGEAADFIKKYFEAFKGVAKYIEEASSNARKKGYAETMFGRRRELPELQSDVAMVRAAGERMATNMPVQGTQADLIKMAMVAVDEALHEAPKDEIRMLLTVHDELVFEVKKGRTGYWAPRLKKIMESITQLSVPLVVEMKSGNNWTDLDLI